MSRALGCHLDRLDGRGRKCRCDVFLGIFAVTHDVDLLARKFGAHRVYSHSVVAYAGSDGIDVLIARGDRKLCARASLTCDALDYYRSVRYFGNLEFKHTAHKAGVHAGERDERPARLAVDLKNIDLYLLAYRELLAGYLFTHAENGMAGVGVDKYIAGLMVYLGDCRGDDLLALLLVSILRDLALGLAYALDYDRLRGSGGQTAEIFGLDLELKHLADGRALVYLACLFEGKLCLGVFDLGYDFLLLIYLHVLLCLVDDDTDVRVVAVFLFISRDKRRFDLFKHILLRYALFLFEHIKCGEKFCVHLTFPFLRHRSAAAPNALVSFL